MLRRFNLFRACTAQAPKAREPIVWVFWDCDGTLFNIPLSSLEKEQFAKLEHLTEIVDRTGFSIFMIYLAKTQEVFKALLGMPNVKIAFITSATYDIGTLYFLERSLELGHNALKGSVFVNRYIFENINRKGEKLQNFIRTGMIGPQDHVLLVDNLQYQVDSAIACGFEAILAEGYCEEYLAHGDTILYHPNDRYLSRVLELVHSKLQEITQLKNAKELGFVVEPFRVRKSQGQRIVVRPELI